MYPRTDSALVFSPLDEEWMTDFEWPLVSVLFITYKRFDMLQKSFESFRRNTNYPRLELVIADDGSSTAFNDCELPPF